MLIKNRFSNIVSILAVFQIISCDLYYDPIPSNSIQISVPNSNTELKVGEGMTIKWDSRGVSEYVRIDLYNNKLFFINIDTMAKNNFEYKWYPSDELAHGENYQIKITDIIDNDIFTFTNNFLIYKSVIFPDYNLNLAINNNLGNPDDLTTKELLFLTTLFINDLNIWNIDGLNNCTNLVELDLSNNHVYQITALGELIYLERLKISSNNITNFNPLELLINIEELEISHLNLSEINFISSLDNINRLVISNNNISDISTIVNLNKIEFLNLSNNQLTDISSITDLSKIRILLLHENQITNIEPILNNTGIDSGDVILLTGNPLNEVSINQYIPQLLNRGVIVTY